MDCCKDIIVLVCCTSKPMFMPKMYLRVAALFAVHKHKHRLGASHILLETVRAVTARHPVNTATHHERHHEQAQFLVQTHAYHVKLAQAALHGLPVGWHDA